MASLPVPLAGKKPLRRVGQENVIFHKLSGDLSFAQGTTLRPLGEPFHGTLRVKNVTARQAYSLDFFHVIQANTTCGISRDLSCSSWDEHLRDVVCFLHLSLSSYCGVKGSLLQGS